MDCSDHPQPYGLWRSVRPSSGQWLPSREPLFCTDSVLVSANDGGVHHHVFKVWIAGEGQEHALPYAAFGQPLYHWNTVFQAPKQSGSSRQCAPVRAI